MLIFQLIRITKGKDMTKTIPAVLLTLALLLTAGPLSAQQLNLAQISAYLNGLETAQGRFRQINQDGSLSTGQIYIKRPGRIRFEYDPPSEALVMAGGGQLAIFDPRSNTGPDRYPLNQTPLNVFLKANVDLEKTQTVTGLASDGTFTRVTAQDPDNPEYGRIDLVFSANPIALREWVVTDDLGGQTRVVLDDMITGGTIRNILFNIRSEMRAREK